ncbi:MAG: hypothetical protein OJF62_000540 [Pseudolabrys sp.]|jgi:hypothetical protein|nr:hypothetical protein [Pseudolabrys sp.]
MRCVLRASVVVLALWGVASGLTVAANAFEVTTSQSRIDIPRIKSVLKLTPQQQAYWPPVEAALRKLAHDQMQVDGLFQRIKAVALDAQTIARIGAAARPLVRVLDERQKQDAVSLCYEMGLGPVLAALY